MKNDKDLLRFANEVIVPFVIDLFSGLELPDYKKSDGNHLAPAANSQAVQPERGRSQFCCEVRHTRLTVPHRSTGRGKRSLQVRR